MMTDIVPSTGWHDTFIGLLISTSAPLTFFTEAGFSLNNVLNALRKKALPAKDVSDEPI